jgi:hypothetical protein
VLTVKALLKEASLNEVFSGGISSYALTALMAAHLQAEGAAPPYLSASVPAEAVVARRGGDSGSEEAEEQQSNEGEEDEDEEEEEEWEEGAAAEDPVSMEEVDPSDTQPQHSSKGGKQQAGGGKQQQQQHKLLHSQDVLQHLQDLVRLPASASEAPGWEAGGAWDYGLLLNGFFRRYGTLVDYMGEAVALARGGVSPKPHPWVPRGHLARSPALAVQDPQQHGRNISPYTHTRLDLLQQTFAWADKALAAAADHFAPSFNGVAPHPQHGAVDLGVIGAGGHQQQQQQQQGAKAATWADVQADGQHRSQAATYQAAASAAPSWEAKQAAALHRQLPVLGEVLSLWAALGRGPGADQLRGELREAAMSMQQALDNKAPKGVKKVRAKMAVILKKRAAVTTKAAAAAGQRGKLRSAGGGGGNGAAASKQQVQQKRQQKKQKKQENKAAKNKKK